MKERSGDIKADPVEALKKLIKTVNGEEEGQKIIDYAEKEQSVPVEKETNTASSPAEKEMPAQEALLQLRADIQSSKDKLQENLLAHNEHGLATYDPKSGFIIIESGEWKVFCNPNNPKEVKKGGSNKYIPNEVWKTMQELKREALKSFKNKQRTFNW